MKMEENEMSTFGKWEHAEMVRQAEIKRDERVRDK